MLTHEEIKMVRKAQAKTQSALDGLGVDRQDQTTAKMNWVVDTLEIVFMGRPDKEKLDELLENYLEAMTESDIDRAFENIMHQIGWYSQINS